MSDPGKHRARDQWGPQEVIAIIIVVGAFILAGAALITDREGSTIPAWVAALVGGVGLFYYKDGKG